MTRSRLTPEIMSRNAISAMKPVKYKPGKRVLAIPSKEIATGAFLAYRNCSALLSEAKLLYKHRRYARCASLCVLGLEEAAKVVQILGLTVRDGKNPETLRRFQKRFSRHREKLGLHDSFFVMGGSFSQDPEHVARFMSQVVEPIPGLSWDGIKQMGFYVDFDPSTKKFTGPSQRINKRIAKAMIGRLEFFAGIHRARLSGQTVTQMASTIDAACDLGMPDMDDLVARYQAVASKRADEIATELRQRFGDKTVDAMLEEALKGHTSLSSEIQAILRPGKPAQ